MVLNDVKEGGSGGSVAAELRPLPSTSLEYVYTNEHGQPQKFIDQNGNEIPFEEVQQYMMM